MCILYFTVCPARVGSSRAAAASLIDLTQKSNASHYDLSAETPAVGGSAINPSQTSHQAKERPG